MSALRSEVLFPLCSYSSILQWDYTLSKDKVFDEPLQNNLSHHIIHHIQYLHLLWFTLYFCNSVQLTYCFLQSLFFFPKHTTLCASAVSWLQYNCTWYTWIFIPIYCCPCHTLILAKLVVFVAEVQSTSSLFSFCCGFLSPSLHPLSPLHSESASSHPVLQAHYPNTH